MPKSLSNRNALVQDLQKLVVEYQSKPSSLLSELEHFLKVNGIRGTAKEYQSFLTEPKWKIRGFKSEAEMKAFEQRTDFPGWDAL